MDQSTRRDAEHGIWPLLLLLGITAIGAASLYFFYLNRMTDVPASWAAAGGSRNDAISWFNVAQAGLVLPLTAGTLGVLIIRRRTAFRIGVLLLGVGVFSAGSNLLGEYAIYGAYTRPGSVAGTGAAAWITNFAWVFLFGSGLTLLSIFPDGRFLSRGWRRALILCLGFFCIPMTFGALIETPFSSAYQIANPFVSSNRAILYDVLFTTGALAMPVAMAAVLAAVIWRFRISHGRVRQQMKWMLAGVTLMAFLVLSGLLVSFGFRLTVGNVMVNVSLLAPLVGVGVALVRHRLYDIDIIIRRTLLYSVTSACLALVYFGSVLLLQTAFSDGAGRSPFVLVISTLFTVALFAPLRARAQSVIDRHFYRARYDTQRTLAQFAAAARDEVDLERLTAALTNVIGRTMQPDRINIWLKEE